MIEYSGLVSRRCGAIVAALAISILLNPVSGAGALKLRESGKRLLRVRYATPVAP